MWRQQSDNYANRSDKAPKTDSQVSEDHGMQQRDV